MAVAGKQAVSLGYNTVTVGMDRQLVKEKEESRDKGVSAVTTGSRQTSEKQLSRAEEPSLGL